MERKDTYCRTTINASLDRMDSKKGYIKGNIQWVYTPINNMKGSLDDNTFTELCGIIYKNSFLNKKEIHEPLSVDFLKKQKNCCGNGCIHCPFNWINVKDKAKRDKLINDSKSKDSSV